MSQNTSSANAVGLVAFPRHRDEPLGDLLGLLVVHVILPSRKARLIVHPAVAALSVGMLHPVLTADDRERIQSKARAAIEQGRRCARTRGGRYPISVAAFLTVALLYSTWAGLQTSGYFARAVHLAALLAVPRRELRARDLPAARLVVGDHAVHPRRLAPDRLPDDVLLLPEGLLPGDVLLAAGVRRATSRCRTRPFRHGESEGPVLAHEPAPLLLLSDDPEHGVPDLGHHASAFRFDDGWHVNVGSLVFVVMIVTMALYMLSCHSCRHVVGGQPEPFLRSACSATARGSS